MKKIIILAGPTAGGKSALAIKIAQKINAVIINCDSKQVYKEIPIITAQPSADEMSQVPHRLYGVISAAEDCSMSRWLDMATQQIEQTLNEGKTPMLVGGTGMYIRALTDGIPQIPDIDDEIRNKVRATIKEKGSEYVHNLLDKQMQENLNPGDSQRVARAYEVLEQTGKSLAYWQQQTATPPFPNHKFAKFFLSPPREQVYENCNIRFEKMMENGVLDEIKNLDAMTLNPDLPAMRAHGVPELLAYLHDNMSLEDAIAQSQRNTRHYIKRQFTWFRHQMTDTVCLEDNAEEVMLKELEE